MKVRVVPLIVTLAVSLVVVVPMGHAAVRDITVGAGAFTPSLRTAVSGDTIKWTWSSGGHDVVGYESPNFGTPIQPAGSSYERTYDGGNLYYLCNPHSTLGGYGVPPSACSGMCGVVTDKTNVPSTPLISQPVDGTADSDGLVDVIGTGEPLTKVTIFEGVSAILNASALIKADGTFHLRIPFYTVGSRTLKARASQPDAAVAASTFSNLTTVNVTGAATDTVNPWVTMSLAPENGTYIYTGTPTIKGNARDNLRVTQVTFTLLSTTGLLPPSTYTASCPGCAAAGPDMPSNWSGKPTGLERGEYYVYATARDAAGNEASAGPVTIYILGVRP